ncbi:hypothetical protein uvFWCGRAMDCOMC429_013 [Freshwater phage uvFW-CGR-AMD-COM-C429]|nr:hypothetical protein uvFWCGRAMDCOMC429_013 [Freshwater phage uvFW-CGR-AMD-COM-C429]
MPGVAGIIPLTVALFLLEACLGLPASPYLPDLRTALLRSFLAPCSQFLVEFGYYVDQYVRVGSTNPGLL